MRFRSFVYCVALALGATLGVVAQTDVHPLSGRRFAPVMSAEGADWLDRSERRSEEDPERALDLLAIPKGAAVADVGAGSGYMTVKLSARVGPTGRVYATVIQPEMLRPLGRRLTIQLVTNVILIPGAVDDPRLPQSAVETCTTSFPRRRQCFGIFATLSRQAAGSCCSSTEKKIRRFRSGQSTK
ncbi:MAG: hypothetical protein DMF92_16425 [Acidobacteria bacterium]|nr:MAG: hypothetical protein DMF92_16425 [Acidobacteriota bacterium]